MKSKYGLMKRIFENQGMKVDFDSMREEAIQEGEYMHVTKSGNRYVFDNEKDYNRFLKDLWAKENPEAAAEAEAREKRRLAKVAAKIEQEKLDREEAAALRRKAVEAEQEELEGELAQFRRDVELSQKVTNQEKESDAKWYNRLNPFYDKQAGTHNRLAKKRGRAVKGDKF